MEAALIPRAEAMHISGHRTESYIYKRYDISVNVVRFVPEKCWSNMLGL
jgi:hypothetical protein